MRGVTKTYQLHGSHRDQLINVLGLTRFGIKAKSQAKEFKALNDISLDVPRGQRIGIVGRNGAGKTTLLKLICGNFAPTAGQVYVNGSVQALMSIGLGFHTEYTGRENVESSLLYSGLARIDYQEAINSVIDFCELGIYFDQPFKSYSLGMQARLMFAAATAIRPDILIVDEVLGAGDAYFVAKSKTRIEKLVSSGCTMLLVSHSMQQVLELCDEAIWLENGSIKMQGESFLVVKAYEESLHGRKNTIIQFNTKVFPLVATKSDSPLTVGCDEVLLSNLIEERFTTPSALRLQDPAFLPHQPQPRFPAYGKEDLNVFRHVARGGVSRWDSEKGVKVTGFSIQTERGFENCLRSLQPAKFIFALTAEVPRQFSCRYGIVLDDSRGNVVTRIWSPPDDFTLHEGEIKIIEMLLNPVQIGPGEYTVGISVLEASEIALVNKAKRYDLLARSFMCTIELDATLGVAASNFVHSAEWQF